jgi:hypothetical protein
MDPPLRLWQLAFRAIGRINHSNLKLADTMDKHPGCHFVN